MQTTQKQNITFDFTTINSDANQPVALMPSWLAVELLKQLALRPVTANVIVGELIDKLRGSIMDVNQAKAIALEFVQTRDLIDNITKENWSAYAVDKPIKAVNHPVVLD